MTDGMCLRCGALEAEFAEEDGAPAGPDDRGYCALCWAIASHVDGVIGCASDCECYRWFGDEIRAAEAVRS